MIWSCVSGKKTPPVPSKLWPGGEGRGLAERRRGACAQGGLPAHTVPASIFHSSAGRGRTRWEPCQLPAASPSLCSAAAGPQGCIAAQPRCIPVTRGPGAQEPCRAALPGRDLTWPTLDTVIFFQRRRCQALLPAAHGCARRSAKAPALSPRQLG